MRTRCTFLAWGITSLVMLFAASPTAHSQMMRHRGVVQPARGFVQPWGAFHSPFYNPRMNAYPYMMGYGYMMPSYGGGYMPSSYGGFGSNMPAYGNYGSNKPSADSDDSDTSATGGTDSSIASYGGYGSYQIPHGAFYSSSSPASAAPQVVVYDNYFEPNEITVTAGTTVRWTNFGKHEHTIASDAGLFESGKVLSGAGFGYKFTAPGTYAYHCTIHAREMRGVVVVK